MSRIEEIIADMRRNPQGIRFRDLCRVCENFFGKARQGGSSHRPTKRHGRATHGSIFRTTKAWQNPIKCGKYFEPLIVWRQNVALKNDRYTYRVTWSEEDNEYVGLCAEFPSLSWLAQTPEAALKGIRKVVADVVADLSAADEVLPEPIATKKYSGKFMVRVPPDLHRRLVLEAAEAGVSLNRIASAKLSQ
jgi:predicted HicB family RNase H-like nuclease